MSNLLSGIDLAMTVVGKPRPCRNPATSNETSDGRSQGNLSDLNYFDNHDDDDDDDDNDGDYDDDNV